MELRQEVAEELIRVKKLFVNREPLVVNRPYREERELSSEVNPEDRFFLNISQRAVEFGRYSTVTRFFQVPLVRICIDPDSVHENPDGVIIKGSHIHFYKAGHDDNFAYPLTDYHINNEEIVYVIGRFIEICNIEKIGIIDQKTLFP